MKAAVLLCAMALAGGWGWEDGQARGADLGRGEVLEAVAFKGVGGAVFAATMVRPCLMASTGARSLFSYFDHGGMQCVYKCHAMRLISSTYAVPTAFALIEG